MAQQNIFINNYRIHEKSTVGQREKKKENRIPIYFMRKLKKPFDWYVFFKRMLKIYKLSGFKSFYQRLQNGIVSDFEIFNTNT